MKTPILLLAFLAPAPALAQSAPAPPAFATSGAFMAFSVPDLEASTRWYAEKFGMRVILRPPPHEGVTVTVLEGGGLLVELQHNPAAVPLRTAAPAITHTTLVHGIFKAGIVVEDYDRTLATLRERGVVIAMGPFPAREGVPANFMIFDNAGNLVQFFSKTDVRTGAVRPWKPAGGASWSAAAPPQDGHRLSLPPLPGTAWRPTPGSLRTARACTSSPRALSPELSARTWTSGGWTATTQEPGAPPHDCPSRSTHRRRNGSRDQVSTAGCTSDRAGPVDSVAPTSGGRVPTQRVRGRWRISAQP